MYTHGLAPRKRTQRGDSCKPGERAISGQESAVRFTGAGEVQMLMVAKAALMGSCSASSEKAENRGDLNLLLCRGGRNLTPHPAG